jgi:hypothetical protein
MVLSRTIDLLTRFAVQSSKTYKSLRAGNTLLAVCCLIGTGFVVNSLSPAASAQTSVTGALSGVVTDASGAVVAGAKVTVTDTATNAAQTVLTNAEGRYTVGLLKPDTYKISANGAGLQSDTIQVAILIGTTVPGDIQVKPTGNTTIVDVNATTLPLIDTQNVALASTFNLEQIQSLPTPAGPGRTGGSDGGAERI